MPTDKLIAYFSMEMALDLAMPTYSGGLGILAGDMLEADTAGFWDVNADGHRNVVGWRRSRADAFVAREYERKKAMVAPRYRGPPCKLGAWLD